MGQRDEMVNGGQIMEDISAYERGWNDAFDEEKKLCPYMEPRLKDAWVKGWNKAVIHDCYGCWPSDDYEPLNFVWDVGS